MLSGGFWGGGEPYESWQLWESSVNRLRLVETILRAWQDRGVDVVVLPGMPMPAQPLGYPAYQLTALSYTAVFNMLDFPVGSVPVSIANSRRHEIKVDSPE